MNKTDSPVSKSVLLSLFLAVSSLVSAAANDPLVLVIHGIGGGNREAGWSTGVADRWMVPVKEITFRQEGRENTSFTDFAKNGGDWARDVQRQIKEAVEANPGRRLIIVSHSWGTVATKLALAGGSTNTEGDIKKIDLGGLQVEEWITIGSPLGRAESPDVAFNLSQLGVILSEGKPPMVKHWTNIYDEADPISNQSHNLAGADNIGVSGSGHWYDPTGLSAHSGLWTNQRVVHMVQQKFDQVGDMPPLPTAAKARPGAGQDEQRYQRLANALIEVHNRDCEARRAKWNCDYRVEYVVRPAPRQKNGAWYIVAAWKMLEKCPRDPSFHTTFESGDAANPQWLEVGAVAALAKQVGVNWE
jgi:hypothetical protein